MLKVHYFSGASSIEATILYITNLNFKETMVQKMITNIMSKLMLPVLAMSFLSATLGMQAADPENKEIVDFKKTNPVQALEVFKSAIGFIGFKWAAKSSHAGLLKSSLDFGSVVKTPVLWFKSGRDILAIPYGCYQKQKVEIKDLQDVSTSGCIFFSTIGAAAVVVPFAVNAARNGIKSALESFPTLATAVTSSPSKFC